MLADNTVGRPRLAYNAMIVFVAILCMVVVGHDLLRTWEDRSHQNENTRREAAKLAWAADQHAVAAFRLADTILTELAERVEADGAGAAQLDRLRQVMEQRLANSSALQSLGLLDETGTLIAYGNPSTQRMVLADRAYFQQHLAHPGRGLLVSGVLRSRINGRWLVVVSRRVDHADGSFAGVVIAAMDVAYFQAFYATFDLGHDGSAGLLSADGDLLLRYPPAESVIGTKLRVSQPFRDLDPSAISGTFDVVSPVDNVRKIFAWRRVAGYPLVVVTGLGEEEKLAVWRTGAVEHLLTAVVIAMLLGFTVIRLMMQVRRLARADAATAAATARYRLIADNASDVVITADLQFIRRYVSPGCRELLGYEPEELVGTSSISLAHPDDIDEVARCCRDMAAGRDRGLLTYRVRHRDGHWVWVEVSLKLMRDPDTDDPMAICAALRDVTRRYEIECEKEQQRRELERSNADLEAFAYSASHDLKAPLRAIMHVAEWIREDIEATAGPETLDHLNVLQGRAARLQMLLDGLLAYSRIGRDQSEFEQVDVAELVADIIDAAPPRPGFVVACADGMPALRACRAPLRMVLDNLIGNGLKHHDGAEGRVCVAMRLADGVAEFRVSDDGPGIPTRFHDRVFEIFQTLASRDEVEGSGIGLAIIKKTVENHGGMVWIESAPPERGATFAFTWRDGRL